MGQWCLYDVWPPGRIPQVWHYTWCDCYFSSPVWKWNNRTKAKWEHLELVVLLWCCLLQKSTVKKKNVLEVCRTIIVYDLMYGVARLLSISLQGICKPFNSWLRSTCNFSPKHPFLIQQTGDENMQTNQAEVVILI